MKKILITIMMLFSVQVFAVDIVTREGQYVVVDTITNTTAGAYENYEIVTLFPNDHKIVVIRPNGRYTTEFCNTVERDSEDGRNCNPYLPDLIYSDWDGARAAGNITVGADLSYAEDNQYTAHWFYQVFIANDLNDQFNILTADLTLTDAQRRSSYKGTCLAYEFDDITCDNFVVIRFDTGRRPRGGEMTLPKVPWRFKKMIDDMRKLTIN